MNNLFKSFSTFDQLVTAFSQKADGPMGLSTKQAKENKRNRKVYFNKLGIDAHQVVQAQLQHGMSVVPVQKANGVPGDGICTTIPNLFLVVTAADCLPVFIYDPDHEAICLIHAGWRGLVAGVVTNGLRVMKSTYHSSADRVWVGIGPGIGPCHYAAKSGVAKQFDKRFISERENKQFIDLPAAAIDQLEVAGVPSDQIECSSECTYDYPDKYFSWRRDQPGELRTMIAVMGLKRI